MTEISGIYGIEAMATRSAFLRLLTNRPDASSLTQALVRGPLSAYDAFMATVYAPDESREALDLIGQWGFGPSLQTYARIPLDVDFPVVRAFLTGEAIVSPVASQRRSTLADTAVRAVLADADRPPDGVTVIAMPLQYDGIVIGASAWLCTFKGPWTWNDHAYIDSTAAMVALWLRLRYYEAALSAAGITGARRASRPHMLTERQREVLGLIRAGKSNAAIAAALGYSISTVKNDVQALFTVFGASKRKELVRQAEAAGFFTEASDAIR